MMNSNCGNELRKPKTRLYNHLSNLGVFQYPVEDIRDGSPISRKNLEVRRGFSPFYIDPTTQELVFVGGVPLTFEDYINEDLRNTIATDYSMNFSEDTKIVSFIYPKYERPYVEFNEEVLEKLERFGYAYLTPIVPPQEEDINPELPEDFLEEFTPNLQVEDFETSGVPRLDFLQDDALYQQELAEEASLGVYKPKVKRTLPTKIKPGVPELFESNPELANAAYEALGFGKKIDSNISIKELEDTDISKEIDILYKGESIGKATLVKSENSDDVDYIEDWSIKGEYQNKRLGYSARQILQNKYPTLKLSSAATDKSKYLYEEAIKNQITPQQKQQAQQLYSQYLDTIFPDTKVKDIVYHGSSEGFEGEDFDTSIITNGRTQGDGIYFSTNKKAVENFAGISQSMYEMFTPQEMMKYLKTAVVNAKKLIDNNEVVVQPEQIHILGNQEDIEAFKKFVSLKKLAGEIYPLSYEISEEERQARFEDFLKNNQNISRDDAEDYFNQCMI